jgi:hypothetical protein
MGNEIAILDGIFFFQGANPFLVFTKDGER